ncbi:hypothetical protein CHARACLAT_008397, partial [Characodon lateralis]|nr:hypothetical protein [Characodon lateralis]
PCAPSNLTVDVDCRTNYARLSWDYTKFAVEYFGHAASMDGETLSCDSSKTSCTLGTLQCGHTYNFTVKAFDGICNSSISLPLHEGAAPCPPSRLNVRMQRIKQMYWAMISWDKVNCSNIEYLAEIKGQIGNNSQTLMKVSSYWLLRPYFELPMPCSTAFTVAVFSRNSGGVSKSSRIFSGITEPCAPQRVKYSGNTSQVLLSWDASVFATMYTVYNVSGGSYVKLCNTTGLSCQLTNFNPAATKVTASNAVGESNPSQNITGPVSARRRRDLQPTQLNAYEGENLETPEVLAVTVSGGSMYVRWRMVKGATEYELIIEEEQKAGQTTQLPRVRNIDGDFYTETDLKPVTTYCVTVAAKDGFNQSNYSWPACRKTGAL